MGLIEDIFGGGTTLPNGTLVDFALESKGDKSSDEDRKDKDDESE